VWAFQGKSLPAVKSMNAPLTGQTVEPERKRRTFARGALNVPHGWSPFWFCPTVSPPSSGDGTPLRTAGQAGTGLLRKTKPLLEGGRALARQPSEGSQARSLEGRIPWRKLRGVSTLYTW